MTAGPSLIAFEAQLDAASDNIAKVQDAVVSAREGAEDIRWAVGTFGRIEQKADEVADIIGGFADVLNLLGKVGPLGRVFKPLERVVEDIEGAVKKVEAKAKKIDESDFVERLKTGTDDAIKRIKELEDDVGEKRDQFDERREPVQETIDALNQAGDVPFSGPIVSPISTSVDAILTAPANASDPNTSALGAATYINGLFASSVEGKLADFNDAVSGNPLRDAQRMEAQLCAIIDQLGFLKEPFAVLNAILKPIRWALDASDFIFDLVVTPVLDPILDAIGVNKLFDGIRNTLSDLLPKVEILNPFDAFEPGDLLPNLEGQLLPKLPGTNIDIDLGDFFDLTGADGFLTRAFDAINPDIFGGTRGEAFAAGTDGNDFLGDLGASVRQILSGGAGIDNLIGGISFPDIFKGGAGDDVIDGGNNETSGDMVIFSGNIAEYLIEFAEDAGEIIITHVEPAVGLLGDGIDRIKNVQTFVFDGLEIDASDLRTGLQQVPANQTTPVSGQPGDKRDFIIATNAGDPATSTGITVNAGAGNDHLIGTRFADFLNGNNGDDVLDGGPNNNGVVDILNGGNGIDEVTFAASARVEGERLDLEATDPSGTRAAIFTSTAAPISIERVEGSDFDDLIFGRDVQFIDGNAANGTYVERLAGGKGSDLLRGFGADDRLEGNEGDDILIGDGGVNQYLGGIGNDLMILDATAPGQQIDGGADFDAIVYGGIPAIVSTFDADTDGWTAPTGILRQQTAGGQAGQEGHLYHEDSAPGVRDYFIAPAKFLGDQSIMMGGRISFDLKATDLGDGVSNFDLGVQMTGGTNPTTGTPYVLEADIPFTVGRDWESFTIALEQKGSWRIADSAEGSGTLATDDIIANVLSNVTAMQILTDRVVGRESHQMDNFVLTAVPVIDPILSQFEGSSNDGWTSVYKPSRQLFTEAFDRPAAVESPGSGGNAGGYARVTNSNDLTWFVAPEAYLGDQTDKLGGRIEWAIRQLSTSTTARISERDEIALVGAGMEIAANGAEPYPSSTWTRWSVDLDPSQWKFIDNPTVRPTDAQFFEILSNLEGLYIRGGFNAGIETIGIDEVRMAPAAIDVSANVLRFADQTLRENPVPGLPGRIVVDVEQGEVRRFNANNVQIATDSFDGVEAISGGFANDRFNAVLAEARDVIAVDGAGGNDVFNVGLGTQIIKGGSGNDRVNVLARGFETGESYDGGIGVDTLDLSQVTETRWRLERTGTLYGADQTLSDADLRDTEAARVRGFERILFGDFDDYSVAEASFVDMGGGNDYVQAGGIAGAEIRLGDGDDEVVSFSAVGNLIAMGLGNDMAIVVGALDGGVVQIFGGPSQAVDANGEVLSDDDVFLVGRGRIDIKGGDGQDIVSFGSRTNYSQAPVTLDLSDATQNAGGAANLTYQGVENASGGAGDDTVRGDANGNLLIGGDGNDLLEGEGAGVAFGQGAGDVLYGNDGNDRLRGQVGDDVLHGGTGTNALEGGPGTDTASYSFEEIGAVFQNGVVQTYNPELFAQITADLGVSGAGAATRLRVLHQDDFEGGVAGFSLERSTFQPDNPEVQLAGLGTAYGPLGMSSAPEYQRTFDLGPDHSGPFVLSFDLVETDNASRTDFEVWTTYGDFRIFFVNGVPTAPSGTFSGDFGTHSWTVTTDPAHSGELGLGLGNETVHRVSITITPDPAERFVTFSFGNLFSPGNDLVLDNFLMTGISETDTLSDIENLTGGALDDDLTGNGANNVLNGADGDDILRGLGGDDVLLDGAGRDTVEGGAGNDTVIAGRGDDAGLGDQYDGGANTDVLDYSGFEGPVEVTPTEALTTYAVERAVWADTQTSEARVFGTKTYVPRDIAQTLDPSLADAADDFTRNLSAIADPAGEIDFLSEQVQATDTHSGFERIIGSGFADRFEMGGSLNRAVGGAGDDTFIVTRSGDQVVERFAEGNDRIDASVSYALPDNVETLNLTGSGNINATGNDGNNRIIGNSGNNVLTGGPGADRKTGGQGADVFVQGPRADNDIITDFQIGPNGAVIDRLNVSNQGLTYAGIGFSSEAAGLRVVLGGESVLLEGVTAPALAPGAFVGLEASGSDAILETGTLALSDAAQTVTLGRTYDNPVALAWVATMNGSDPVVVRLEEVAGNQMTLRLQEPNSLDGGHTNETVNWMVVEKGTWVLPDGTLLEAGTLRSNKLSGEGFEDVRFGAAFDAAPVVLSQVQTDNGSDFVVTRQTVADADGLGLTMQEEEALNSGAHAQETLGYVAIDGGQGGVGGFDWVAGRATGVSDARKVVDLSSALTSGAQAIAALSSFAGADPAWARGEGGGPGQFSVSVEEDQSLDAETNHTGERVDYLAFDGPGTLSDAPLQDILEAGTLSLTDAAQTVELGRSFLNPVAFAWAATENGNDPVTVRLDAVGTDTFSLRLQEPNYLDGTHGTEKVHWVVVEAGVWVLPNGARLEAGTLQSNKLTSNGFDSVQFGAGFNDTPVVLSQVQTLNGADFVVTRQRGTDASGFDVSMQEEEAQNESGHTGETIGWLAVDAGTGTESGVADAFVWAAGRAGGISDQGARVDVAVDLGAGGGVVAGLSTYAGADPAWARGDGVVGGDIRVSAEEDRSLDPETFHNGETVDWFAFAEAGILHAYDPDHFI